MTHKSQDEELLNPLHSEYEEEEEEGGEDGGEGNEEEGGEGEEGEDEGGKEGEEGEGEGEGDEEDEDSGEGEDEVDPDKIEVLRKREQEEKDEEEEDVDEDDQKTIGKVVEKKTRELRQETQDLRDEMQVDSLVVETPELKKYKGAALRYMKVHTNLTAQDAMAIVSSKAQQKIGARKEREAIKKTSKTKSGGSSTRPSKGGAKDYSKMSDADMEVEIAKAKGQRI